MTILFFFQLCVMGWVVLLDCYGVRGNITEVCLRAGCGLSKRKGTSINCRERREDKADGTQKPLSIRPTKYSGRATS